MQHGRQREYEDGEGGSPGKKDGSAAHQGSRAPMRWRMGQHGGVSLRAVAQSRRGACRRPVEGELAGVDLEVREEKGTSEVLVEVRAALEVIGSGSTTRGPRWRVDDIDRLLWGCSGYRLGQEAAGRSVGGCGVLHL
jgi:hypothetical protein